MPRRGPELDPRAPPRAFCPGLGRTCPFPLHLKRPALTVRGGASPLSRVASGLRDASGLWLLACNLSCELTSCARPPARPPPPELQPSPFGSRHSTTRPGMHSARAGGGVGHPLRVGPFPLPGVRARLLPTASGAKASGSRGQ